MARIKKFKDIGGIDYVDLTRTIREYISCFTDEFGSEDTEEGVYESNGNAWALVYRNDGNYYFYITFGDAEFVPYGCSNDIEYLKGSKYYSLLKESLNNLSHLDGPFDLGGFFILFNYENIPDEDSRARIHIQIIVNEQDKLDDKKSDEYLSKMGIGVGVSNIIMNLNKYILQATKPDPLGSEHPDSRTGKEYFATSGYLDVLDKNYKVILGLNLDERGPNSISLSGGYGKLSKPIQELKLKIYNQLNAMKKANPRYGTYDYPRDGGGEPKGGTYHIHLGNGLSAIGREGRDYLYRHDFMVWLKNHQSEL